MNMQRKIGLIIAVTGLLVWPAAPAGGAEPEKPFVDGVFDVEKELKINEIAGLPVEEALKRLTGMEFLTDEELLNKSVSKAFGHRKTEAIASALDRLRLPAVERGDGGVVNRSTEFHVCKKVMEVFPEEAAGKVLLLYRDGDEVTRGNLIRASGRMAGGTAIRTLLLDALDDQTVAGDAAHPEMMGAPLRICDIAYNQLVLRYAIRDVLRTIGTVHKIENRDHHINILKGLLGK
jgi:hypothetical protein